MRSANYIRTSYLMALFAERYTREAPLSPIHLENLLKLSRIPGVKIVPPLVNNYQRVGSVSELERQIALKLVGYLGFDSDELIRWNPSAI